MDTLFAEKLAGLTEAQDSIQGNCNNTCVIVCFCTMSSRDTVIC